MGEIANGDCVLRPLYEADIYRNPPNAPLASRPLCEQQRYDEQRTLQEQYKQAAIAAATRAPPRSLEQAADNESVRLLMIAAEAAQQRAQELFSTPPWEARGTPDMFAEVPPCRCIGHDPLCPCQDGDACHYRETASTKAWPTPAEPTRSQQLAEWAAACKAEAQAALQQPYKRYTPPGQRGSTLTPGVRCLVKTEFILG